MYSRIYRRQVGAFIFTAIAGTFLHFLFDLIGQQPMVGIFSAVNESIWEHMKLLFVPMLIAAAANRILFGSGKNCFWFGKLVGITTGLVLIPALYYTYTGALGVHFTWLDISIFYIAAAAGYLAEIIFLRCGSPCSKTSERIAVIALMILAVAFILFTYFPPKLPIFQDPVTRGYGIII